MSEKPLFDRFLDAVFGEESHLPTVVALAAVRVGEETEFSYREWFAGWQAWQLVSTKRFVDIMISRDPRMRGKVVVTLHEAEESDGASIEMNGRVKTEVFGELMHNEFSCWTRRGRFQRRYVGNVIRLSNLWLDFRARGK